MRALIIFLLIFGCSAGAAYSDGSPDFDSFMQSREVVATLYFQVNSEDLVKGEQERIQATIPQLRELQNQGRMIRVEGFSSPDGDKEHNFQLSFFRARTVADFIDSKELPAEIALTGYGDLLAESADPLKERRVEIVSYLKPVPLKRIKLAKKKGPVVVPQPDFTRVPTPEGLEINSMAVDQAIKLKLADKKENLAGKDPEIIPIWSPKLTQASDLESPVIDALTIEQAIMEKIGMSTPPATDAVSQVVNDY